MSTLNVSMPEAMRQYVDKEAAQGQYSASEYVRHLIRKDQQRKAMMAEYIEISARQLDAGDYVEISADEFLAEMQAGRRRPKRQAKKPRTN